MFTGIVQSLGTIRRIVPTTDGWRLTVDLPSGFGTLIQGMSLAVNGICVSVVEYKSRQCTVDIMPETGRRTTFHCWRVGDKVNLERPLRSGDEMSGHFVTGHIDGVGKVLRVVRRQREVRMIIKVPQSFMRYIAAQGAVAIDGISLTVARVRGKVFTVALIPYTLTHTVLGNWHVGDMVNIEVDILARYLDRLMTYGK
ncbi:MAG: riboflavin synthase [Patescibacteria group bacterium]